MICPACKGIPHDDQPEGCKGGTWCDCHHRDTRKMNEESKTSNKLVDPREGNNV